MTQSMTLVHGDGQTDTYRVSLAMTDVVARSPREAVDVFRNEAGGHADDCSYNVTNEQTGDEFEIDLEGDGNIRYLGRDGGPNSGSATARLVITITDPLAPELLDGIARRLSEVLIADTDVLFTLHASSAGAGGGKPRVISRTGLPIARRAV